MSVQSNDLGFFVRWALLINAKNLDFNICDIAYSTLIAASMEWWSNREFSHAMSPPAMTNYKLTSCC
ncbi:MAG: hypothetical protein V7K81_16660 [Nostoc sp.]